MRAAAILGAMVALAAPATARPVVAAASGAIAAVHPPGSQVGDDDRLELRAGDAMVLVTRAGTRNLAGPAALQLDPDAEPTLAAAGVLALPDPVQLAALPPAADPPGLWTIDVAHSDTVCVADRLAIALWRADTSAPLALQLSRRGVPTAVPFGVGQAIAMVPPTVAVADNDVLTLHGPGRPVTLTIRMIRAPKRLDTLAAALVKAGCQGQLARLAALTRLAD